MNKKDQRLALEKSEKLRRENPMTCLPTGQEKNQEEKKCPNRVQTAIFRAV